MPFAKLIHALRRLASGTEEFPVAGLNPPEIMRKILDRERARADRAGDPVAVIAFTPHGSTVDTRTLVHLAQGLVGRVRFTDVVGWLDDRQLCAVLPCTGLEGARKVAEEVCVSLPEAIEPPLCSIYIYPQDRVPIPQSDPATATTPAPRPSIAVEPPVAVQPAGATAMALDSLLVKPMPRWKRALDILGAGTGLLILSPVLLLVALAIKLTSRGPIFFRQWRSGRGGKPFLMYKFRTMVVDAEARKAELMKLNEQDGPAFKIRNDPRVTRLGRILRKTSLDELPQLWNVLVGDMSLVGPRPLPCKEADACEGWQRRRLDVTPGLTCIWQVRGRSTVSFNDWVRMDLQYIRGQSLPQDIKLLLQTVPAVLLRKGAS